MASLEWEEVMDLSGLIAEMLLPGMLILLAIFVPSLEFKIFDISPIKGELTIFILFYFGIFAYLLGIATRHLSVLKSPSYYYCISIHKYWSMLARRLVREMTEVLGTKGMDGTHVPRLSMPEDEKGKFSSAQGQELISWLRDRFLAEKEGALSEYLMYQWNLARLARNCHLPLLLVGLSCAIACFNRSSNNETLPTIYYASAALGCLGLAFGMRKVYKDRIFWHVDILMRVAATELGDPTHNGKPSEPSTPHVISTDSYERRSLLRRLLEESFKTRNKS
jgi:hypothetical protein